MNIARCLAAIALICGCGVAPAVEVQKYPTLDKIFNEMVARDQYPEAELRAVFARAQIDRSVLRRMAKPREALPWPKYRQLFISENRIRRGVAFMRQHQTTLTRAAQTYGVPPEIITAILGVETNYGARTGDVSVLNALVTLTALHLRRSRFFGKELRAFLRTARTEGVAAHTFTGSYAGAMGIPQFMPTSYSAYAVDFNANGRRDLRFEFADAIGSAANYLKRHGWRAGRRIFIYWGKSLSPAADKLVSRRAKPARAAEELHAAGVAVEAAYADEKMALLRLAGDRRHIIAFANFYAITRYNPSINYALAVAELAAEIRRAHDATETE